MRHLGWVLPFMLIGCSMNPNKFYKFSDHLDGTKWIEELPTGYLSNEIDLNFHTVNVMQQTQGYTISVGPLNPYEGGSAITVYLDRDLKLINYLTETLEPAPKD